MSKDTLDIEFVKNANYNPTSFEYVGMKGGFGSKTNEHIN